MRVNIYYGGRGLVDDPTLYVIDRISTVLDELQVPVERYNLFEEKSKISVLPKTMKNVDGVILAASVEWFGYGGYLQQFLDACWLYGDKKMMEHIYMLPVVMATTYGEREAEYQLIRAWEMLGGIPCEGLCAYVADHVEFEASAEYKLMIDKKTENFYRTISHKVVSLPNSSMQVKKKMLRTNTIPLTPQESEQLSAYVANDDYVKRQKKDIEELTNHFKDMLGEGPKKDEYIEALKEHFYPMDNINAIYQLELEDENSSIIIEIHGEELVIERAAPGQGSKHGKADVVARVKTDVFDAILAGEKSFQGAFMKGDMPSVNGNFTMVRNFDTLFRFNEPEEQEEEV